MAAACSTEEGGFLETYKQQVETLGDLTIVRPSGFIDAHTAPELERALNNLVSERRFKVILDCQLMDYISSAGLGVLMGAISTYRQNQGDLKIAQMPAKVFKVFDLLGFSKLFEVFDTKEEAIAAFREGSA
jgi:anti-sigma B factor antagonist